MTALPTRFAARPRLSRRAASSIRRPATGTSRKRTVVMRSRRRPTTIVCSPILTWPFDLTMSSSTARGETTELPDAKCARFEADFGIKGAADAEQIAGDPEFADFFEAAAAGMAGKEAQTVANLLVNDDQPTLRA